VDGSKVFAHAPDTQRRSFDRSRLGDGYHLITPFCQTSTRSRSLNSPVMMLEKNPAIITRAPKTFPYSAQPCAQLTYHPRPDLTPTFSATTRVKNDVPSPMNSPMKILGIAAGMATRKTR